jgi:hypothetical protein
MDQGTLVTAAKETKAVLFVPRLFCLLAFQREESGVSESGYQGRWSYGSGKGQQKQGHELRPGGAAGEPLQGYSTSIPKTPKEAAGNKVQAGVDEIEQEDPRSHDFQAQSTGDWNSYGHRLDVPGQNDGGQRVLYKENCQIKSQR